MPFWAPALTGPSTKYLPAIGIWTGIIYIIVNLGG